MDRQPARSPILYLPAQALDFRAPFLRLDRAADTAAAGTCCLARGFNIDRLLQERFQAADRVVKIAVLAPVGLRLDDDYPVLCDARIAEIIDTAAIGFRDVKGVQIAAELHRRIRFIDRLPARP